MNYIYLSFLATLPFFLLETRSKLLCPELGLLEHYHVNLGASHIPCTQVTRKRKHNIADIMKLDPNKANITVFLILYYPLTATMR